MQIYEKCANPKILLKLYDFKEKFAYNFLFQKKYPTFAVELIKNR